MSRLITTARIKQEYAKKLQRKAIELTVATNEIVSEADIVHWILAREIDRVNVEEWKKEKELERC